MVREVKYDHFTNPYSTTISRDGAIFTVHGPDNLIDIRDARTGNLLHTLRGHMAGVWAADFSQDGGRLVSSSGDYSDRCPTCSSAGGDRRGAACEQPVVEVDRAPVWSSSSSAGGSLLNLFAAEGIARSICEPGGQQNRNQLDPLPRGGHTEE